MMKPNQSDRLAAGSSARRSEGANLADELLKAAAIINWPRTPELREFESIAELLFAPGYYAAEELMGASTAGRTQLYKLLAAGKPGGPRLMRKIIDSEAPPTELEDKQAPPYEELDIFAAAEAIKFLRGVGEILRPSQEAVNIFCEALRDGGKARPPHTPFLLPKPAEAPRSPQDAVRKRAQYC